MIDKTIVSVHTPKTGGASLRSQLKSIVGDEAVLFDYDVDDPVNPKSVFNLDPYSYEACPIRTIAPYRVVHGHFPPHKYDNIENTFRMTFLRHPLDNVISIYFFFMAVDRDQFDHPIIHYVKDNKLSLDRFVRIPKIRYLYSRSYYGNYDMNKFDFIGDYSKYNDELIRLGTCIGIRFEPNLRINVTEDMAGCPANYKNKLSLWSNLDRKGLYALLSDDIEFYETYKGR